MSLASAAVTGALGGSVNLVTKRATNEPITQLTTRHVSNSQIGTHLDVGRRLGAGNEFGIRFNGSIDGGRTPIDKQRSKLGGAALFPASGMWAHGSAATLAVDGVAFIGALCFAWMAIATMRRIRTGPADSIWSIRKPDPAAPARWCA